MRTTTSRLLVLTLALGGLLLATHAPAPEAQGAAPQPKPVPTRWQLRLDPGPLRTMVVRTDSEGERAFYYFTYEVANTTGEDRSLAPSFELVTDLGEILRSGSEVPIDVPEKIIERLNDPLLESELDVQGVLPQGRENARRGLVVWPADDIQIDEVTIYAAGFSGETVKVVRPDTGEEIVLRKTLMLRHEVPGELIVDNDDPLERTVEQWVMR